MNNLFPYPKSGNSWLEILEDPLTRKLLGHDAAMAEKVPFVAGVHARFKFLLQDPLKHLSFAKIGYTSLEAFVQANCTGPPLEFDPTPVIIPGWYSDEIPTLKEQMLKSLSMDGIDVYPLVPHIELFWLAKCMMDSAPLAEEGFNGRRARFRINFWHQKLLPELSGTLRHLIYKDGDILETQMSARLIHGGAAAQEHMVEYLVERANVRIYYGDEMLAREDLLRAAKLRDFEFALTGALGKRTKFQEKEISQLVVMARSGDLEPEPYHSRKSSRVDSDSRKNSFADRSPRNHSIRASIPGSPNADMAQMFSSIGGTMSPAAFNHPHQPQNLLLHDDTLLENIEFTTRQPVIDDPATEIVSDKKHLPGELAFMEPADQPQLFPMDSIILLSIAATITNNTPSDGLTREQSLPYATRVLQGGSSNWSVYSQALLLRSRIEGYVSRTAERGLLQFQALVDQVIAETTGTDVTARTDGEADASNGENPTTFFPKSTTDEGASVAERLRFVHQVHPPFRWELEVELATRWAQMGGLKTALEIYERLQLHAEVALCLAATDREAEATALLKKILFVNPDQSMRDGDMIELQKPVPTEAARMLCILGDIEEQPKYYNVAWTASGNRYARAQRSLGKFYLKRKDLPAAAEAYTAALKISRQDTATWFALGCVELDRMEWQSAVEAFTRTVQLEDKDAQAWSNLAVALLRLPVPVSSPDPLHHKSKPEEEHMETINEGSTQDDEQPATPQIDPLRHTREALRALRRAAQLKRDDSRIMDNYLTVAASIPPNPEHPELGTPWQEVAHAMSSVISLRHKREGESCVDLKILDALVDHVTNTWDFPIAHDDTDTDTDTTNPHSDPQKDSIANNTADNADNTPDPHHIDPPRLPFLVRATLTLIDTQIVDLATSSSELFLILSRVAFWRHRPAESLALIEKSWRATTNNVSSTPRELVDSTAVLVNGYRALGTMQRERTGGIVEKGWRFKSRSAVRSVLGRARSDGLNWVDTGHKEEVEELEEMMRDIEESKESDIAEAK